MKKVIIIGLLIWLLFLCSCTEIKEKPVIEEKSRFEIYSVSEVDTIDHAPICKRAAENEKE